MAKPTSRIPEAWGRFRKARRKKLASYTSRPRAPKPVRKWVSWSHVLKSIPRGAFSVEAVNQYKYRYIPFGNDYQFPHHAPYPHIVLRDKHHTDRFVLGYEAKPVRGTRGINLFIDSIQRIRTQKDKKTGEWDPKAEIPAQKEFQKELGGVHPGEFILAQFILHYGGVIKEGVKIFRKKSDSPNAAILWAPILERYFKRVDETTYVLDTNKKRVKELLELARK